LEDGTKVSVRPSGTEPKIKFYIAVNTKLKSREEFLSATEKLDTKITAVEKYLLSV
jgi:phosphoglucomutase